MRRLSISYPRCASERPDSRACGAARLGRQREDTGQPDKDPAAVRHPPRAGADPEHAAQHRCQPGSAQPAHGECKDWNVYVRRQRMSANDWLELKMCSQQTAYTGWNQVQNQVPGVYSS